MRNADQTCVNGHVLICLAEPELQFSLGLLTRLKADDLVTEDDRLQAIQVLLDHLARVREVTGKQSSVSQGEETTQ